MDSRIKDTLLGTLDGPQPNSHPLTQVLDRVNHELGVPKAAIKVAIWELYADGLVELTPDWDLRSTAKYAGVAAIA